MLAIPFYDWKEHLSLGFKFLAPGFMPFLEMILQKMRQINIWNDSYLDLVLKISSYLLIYYVHY